MSLTTENVQITTSKGAKMGAYLARPSAPGRLPAVIVFMEIFGVNDHIRDVTRRVAAEGYVAIAPTISSAPPPASSSATTRRAWRRASGT